MRQFKLRLLALAMGLVGATPAIAAPTALTFDLLWRHAHVGDAHGEAGAEIAAYDTASQRVFVVNGANQRVDVLNATNGKAVDFFLDLAAYGSPNGVAVANGLVAVAVANDEPQARGRVVFYEAATPTDSVLNALTVGALPDMVTFSPDGKRVVVANEGEPGDYDPGSVDPEGSVSIISFDGTASGLAKLKDKNVAHVGFRNFNGDAAALAGAGVRLFGPGATVAQDLEPEYVAVSPDGTKAYVTLQENNALAVVDLVTHSVDAILPLGTKDHSLADSGFADASGVGNSSNALDVSDKDGAGSLANPPVRGMYMPDAIASYTVDGKTYYVTANEGDAREYEGPSGSTFTDESRIGKAPMDAAAPSLPGGRLNISLVDGDTDGDGDIDVPHSFGARSFSIWDEAGHLIWDSGDFLERQTLADGTFNEGRSDNKGPEPEGVVMGTIGDRTYAFIGLERTNGVMAFDVTDPTGPLFVGHLFTDTDVGPEGLFFVSADDSFNGRALLGIANEVSSTTTLFAINAVPLPPAAWLLGSALVGLGVLRRRG